MSCHSSNDLTLVLASIDGFQLNLLLLWWLTNGHLLKNLRSLCIFNWLSSIGKSSLLPACLSYWLYQYGLRDFYNLVIHIGHTELFPAFKPCQAFWCVAIILCQYLQSQPKSTCRSFSLLFNDLQLLVESLLKQSSVSFSPFNWASDLRLHILND